MKSPLLSEEQIERRLPVWIALSDTFLDTELTDDAYRSIARTIEESGFSPEEAFEIYRREVAPAFAVNLLSVAGEWAGRDEYVQERVFETLGSWRARAVVWTFFRGHIREEWARILALL